MRHIGLSFNTLSGLVYKLVIHRGQTIANGGMQDCGRSKILKEVEWETDYCSSKSTCQHPLERESVISCNLHITMLTMNIFMPKSLKSKLVKSLLKLKHASYLHHHDTGRENDCLPQIGKWNMMNIKMANQDTLKTGSAKISKKCPKLSLGKQVMSSISSSYLLVMRCTVTTWSSSNCLKLKKII